MRLQLWVLALCCLHASADKCVPCEAGTFCFLDDKYRCPSYSTSVPQADNITAFVCRDGYRQHSSANHSCVPCEAGTYCVAERQRPCPPRSDSAAGSADLAACVCHAGYAGAPAEQRACTACPAAQYEAGSECVGCSANSTSAEASAAVTDCRCTAGFTGPDGQTCSACAAGKFKPLLGPDACTPCAADSHVLVPGSRSADACECRAGFTRLGGGCRRCALGTYKGTLSDGACAQCPLHANTSGTGSTLFSDCLCAAGHGFNGTACNPCGPGRASPGGYAACSMCVAGKAAPAAGSSACTECASDSWQGAPGQATCQACPGRARSAAGSTAQTDCRCDAGFTGQDACSACVAGKFKDVDGPGECEGCEIGTTTSAAAAETAGACVLCLAEQYGVVDGGAATCASCEHPTTLVKPEGSTGTCQCQRGFGGAECAPCSAGYYKNAVGMQECGRCEEGEVSGAAQALCTVCPADTFEAGREQCRGCPSNSRSAARSHDACTCDDGFPLLDGNCSACPPGAYESGDECVLCGANTFSAGVAAVSPAACLACPANSTSAAGATHALACLCVPGYTGTSACVPCAEGAYKAAPGTAPCVECAAGTHWPAAHRHRASNQCRACPGNSTSGPAAHGVYNCHCDAGFRRVDDACEHCRAGTYCAGGLAGLRTCGPQSSSAAGSAAITDCACVPGHYGANGTCAMCPVNRYCEGGREARACAAHAGTLTLPGRSSVSACVCDRGYYEFAEACVACPIDSYCYLDGRFRCGPNSTSFARSNNATDCYYDAGFVMGADGCRLCAAGVLCAGVRTSFNALTLSVAFTRPSSSLRRLLATPGWFVEADAVSALAVWLGVEHATVTVLSTEVLFDAVTLQLLVVTPSAAVARSMSRALPRDAPPAGLRVTLLAQFESDDPAVVEETMLRVPGLVATVVVAVQQGCAVNATVERGACVCRPGRFCSSPELGNCFDDALCLPCAAASHCSGNTATPCPGNETSPALSGAAAACGCLSGYYRTNNSNCELCPLHAYCAAEKRHECAAYDEGRVTDAPGRTALADCRCRSGLFRLRATDACQPCPHNFYCPSELEVFACMQYGFTEHAGSTSKAQCLCAGGYQWDESDDSCLACVDNRCGGGVVAEYCQATFMPSRDHQACVCRPGLYSLNLGECQPCQPGHVRPERGNGPCVACPVGTHSANTTHCVLCAADMNTSDTGNTHCLCNAPLMFAGGRCEPCPVDTFFQPFDTDNGPRVGALLVTARRVTQYDSNRTGVSQSEG